MQTEIDKATHAFRTRLNTTQAHANVMRNSLELDGTPLRSIAIISENGNSASSQCVVDIVANALAVREWLAYCCTCDMDRVLYYLGTSKKDPNTLPHAWLMRESASLLESFSYGWISQSEKQMLQKVSGKYFPIGLEDLYEELVYLEDGSISDALDSKTALLAKIREKVRITSEIWIHSCQERIVYHQNGPFIKEDRLFSCKHTADATELGRQWGIPSCLNAIAEGVPPADILV